MSTFHRSPHFHHKSVRTTMNRIRCLVCHGYFDRETAYWSKGLSRICTEECFNEHQARQRRKNTPSTKPGRAAPKIPVALRFYIKERDEHCCRWCGRRGTQCHHVTFKSQGGQDEPSNLILLCSDCHRDRAHGAEAKRYRELFRAYIWLAMVEGRVLTVPEVEALCRPDQAA